MADALDALLARGQPADVIHLGGGGFALPRFLAATRPAIRQEVYEVEPEIVALAERHLRLRRSPSLRVRTGDARALLTRRADGSADAVVGDAFAGTELPPQLTTLEFAQEVRRVLRPGGLYVLNTVDVPPLSFARAKAATLHRTFAHALAFGARGVLRGRSAGNVLFAASDAPLPLTALERRFAGGPYPSDTRPAAQFAEGAEPLRDETAATPRARSAQDLAPAPRSARSRQ
jgi:spermidine synthase